MGDKEKILLNKNKNLLADEFVDYNLLHKNFQFASFLFTHSSLSYQQCLSVSYPNYTDWNKINEEDSSVLGYHSSRDDQQFQILTPKIPKIFSNPETNLIKLKSKNSMNDTTETNLQKLYDLSAEEVWLFVPKSLKDNNSSENDQILKKLKNTTKIIQNTKGWNILISNKQQAKRLIEFGFKKDNILFKFYVSTKNYDLVTQMNRKGSATSSIRSDNEIYDSYGKQRKVRYEQQNTKKKLKFIQKNNNKNLNYKETQLKESEKYTRKEIVIDGLDQSNKPQIQRPQFMQYASLQTIKYDQSHAKISLSTSINLTNELIGASQSQNIQIEVSTENQQLYHVKTNEKYSEKQNDEKMKQNHEESPHQEYDSEESLQRMKKALKKKNKKLNKKKRNPNAQINYTDENNPFSLLEK